MHLFISFFVTDFVCKNIKLILVQSIETVSRMLLVINPLPDMPILGFSNSVANKDMMSKIWTNGDTILSLSRNIVGKGEIAHYEQFLLFPQCFQKLSVVDASK